MELRSRRMKNLALPLMRRMASSARTARPREHARTASSFSD